MKYYRFIAETPFCGTDQEHYVKFDQEPTEEELAICADGYREDVADSFEYLLDDEEEEERENFRADCTCDFEEITKEEYEENA